MLLDNRGSLLDPTSLTGACVESCVGVGDGRDQSLRLGESR